MTFIDVRDERHLFTVFRFDVFLSLELHEMSTPPPRIPPSHPRPPPPHVVLYRNRLPRSLIKINSDCSFRQGTST